MLTVKDLASEIGVSKVAISKKIERLGLKDKLIKDGNRFVMPDDIADQIRASYQYRTASDTAPCATDAHQESTAPGAEIYADVIQVLKDQLAEKDKQIERLQVLLARNQELLLPSASHDVDAETVNQDDDRQEPSQDDNRSWWRRFFG